MTSIEYPPLPVLFDRSWLCGLRNVLPSFCFVLFFNAFILYAFTIFFLPNLLSFVVHFFCFVDITIPRTDFAIPHLRYLPCDTYSSDTYFCDTMKHFSKHFRLTK